MKAVVSAFNQEKALVGAFTVITNLQMQLFEALVNGHMTVNTHQLAAHTEPVLNFSIKPNNTIETSIPQPRAVAAVAAPATLHLEQPHPVQHTQAVLLSHANMNTDTWLVAIVKTCPTHGHGHTM